jgi:large subunit ribosomal protein L3
MTHGSKSKREHGSTGPGSTPGRVFPGLKAAGQMGNIRAKLRKVEVRGCAPACALVPPTTVVA